MSQFTVGLPIMNKFLERTPKSRAINIAAQRVLPGGNSRNAVYFKPYPIYVAQGKGCRIYDVDSNEYIDFLNNYTSLILGHAYPSVIAAVQAQLNMGTSFGASTELEAQLAEMIHQRMPAIKQLRYTNSGSEATLNAIRAARAFTGKPKLAKIEGGYNGSHDSVQVSVRPPIHLAGSKTHPRSIPDAAGIPDGVVKDILVLPFNNGPTAEQLIQNHAKDLAAVIVEPILGAGGVIPPREDFLNVLREVTEQHDVLLIFDEIITFRIAKGGAQERYNVRPDLTTLGKIIGGGFPVGAFGGREDIMMLFSPNREPPILPHSGTFNGNPITLVAGITTLNELTSSVYEKLEAGCIRLRSHLTEVFEEVGVKAQVTGEASLFNIHFTNQEIIDYRDAAAADKELASLLFLDLLNRGISLAPRGMGCLSTPMTKKELEALIIAVKASLMELREHISPYKPSFFK
ncbi:MAG: aspartate aminotransferase family protein [Candidatus Heimdallarchaeota archaeon]